MSRIAFCDDLGEPELGIVLDLDWLKENRNKIEIWSAAQGLQVSIDSGGLFILKDPSDRIAFLLEFGR